MQISSNAAVPSKLSDILNELGGIPDDRVRCDPWPGTATLEDLQRAHASGGLCELVDGTLVDKAMGWQEAVLAAYLVELIAGFARRHNLGLVTGPDGFVRLLGTFVRGPDVAFVSWKRLPEGRLPEQSIPDCVPDLVVEVLSLGNTLGEMSRKRREYFHAGVGLVWMVDPRERTVAVFTGLTDYIILDESQTLSGGDVLPGLEIPLAELFAELDRRPPE